LRLDLLEKIPECCLIRCVAAEHFMGQRKSIRRHDQGDDHLHAVRPLVAAIAELAFVAFAKRRIALEACPESL
jgi:hypothetical protein